MSQIVTLQDIPQEEEELNDFFLELYGDEILSEKVHELWEKKYEDMFYPIKSIDFKINNEFYCVYFYYADDGNFPDHKNTVICIVKEDPA